MPNRALYWTLDDASARMKDDTPFTEEEALAMLRHAHSLPELIPRLQIELASRQIKALDKQADLADRQVKAIEDFDRASTRYMKIAIAVAALSALFTLLSWLRH